MMPKIMINGQKKANEMTLPIGLMYQKIRLPQFGVVKNLLIQNFKINTLLIKIY